MPGRRITSEPPPLTDTPPAAPAPPNHPNQGSFMAPPQEYEYTEERRRLVDEEASKTTTLSDDMRFEFTTLLQTGKGTKTIDVLGHEVVIENLNCDDDLRVGAFCKPYLGSDAYDRAWQLGTCAAGVRTIDGRAVYNSLEANPSMDHVFAEKVSRLGKFMPVTITEIYRAIGSIDVRFVEVAIELGKLKG